MPKKQDKYKYKGLGVSHCRNCEIQIQRRNKYKGLGVSHCGICEIVGWSVAKPWFMAPSNTCPHADIYCNWKTSGKKIQQIRQIGQIQIQINCLHWHLLQLEDTR